MDQAVEAALDVATLYTDRLFTINHANGVSLPGDCLMVSTVASQKEEQYVSYVVELVMSHLPSERLFCRRVRQLVHCKPPYLAPSCNITWKDNIGLECSSIMATLMEPRLRALVGDAL